MSILKALNRKQKEAVAILQTGTFLEYFDLMLYVHMAVLLNELFFPKTDPHTTALLSSFAFCSTFILRPVGALIFGFIGDHMGRKTTVILTMTMMSTSCIVMANLPTYAQIGISAAWAVTICRIMQGFSSMGEIMSAQVYMTEITKPPVQYPAVTFINVAASVGTVFALGIATLVATVGFNWRIAFWVGAIIALVGSIARTRLRETPEFVEKSTAYKSRRLSSVEVEKSGNKLNNSFVKIESEKIKATKIRAFFIIHCGWPLCFYLAYMYFNPILKNTFGYTSEDIIFHNFLLAIIQLASSLFLAIISYKFHPLKILRVIGWIFLALVVLLPFFANNSTSCYHIFAMQAAIVSFSIGSVPADAVLIKNFPVLRRITAVSLLYSLARAIMYIITSFGLVYLTEIFGHYGLLLITLPVALSFLWAIGHYAVLENVNFPKLPSIFRKKTHVR